VLPPAGAGKPSNWRQSNPELHAGTLALEGECEMTTEVSANQLTHLQRLESESIHIMREAVAESEQPVMLYSIGKDSTVLLHLAKKAFYPSPPPFPLLHVDTTWKFQAMYAFREKAARDAGVELLVHQNPYCLEMELTPSTMARRFIPTCGRPRG
jgi:sulfate adenylyltransferase subunit 2